jgi:hypothetical protein
MKSAVWWLVTLLVVCLPVFTAGQVGGRFRFGFESESVSEVGISGDLSVKPKPAAELRFTNMRPGKPPLSRLFFDLTLRNDRSGPRWFLLPGNIGSGNGPLLSKGGVDTLQVYAPVGDGHVVIGRFLGNGGFQAILLPAGAQVVVHNFPISYWGELPASLNVEVLVTKTLTIGGKPSSEWFGIEPLSSKKADVTDSGDDRGVLRSKHSPDNKEVPVVADKDQSLTVSVSLSGPRN